MKTFLVVLVVALGVCYTNSQCPPENLIKPCKCGGFLPLVECGDLTRMETLEDVFKRSGDRKFRLFALYNSTLMYLPATAISSKGFDNLLLVNVSMSALFNARPIDANEISIIMLQDVKFQRGVGWELFGPLKKLGLFHAERTEIRSLGKSFTDNINKGITNIILKETKTKKIHNTAFAQLTKLFDLEIIKSEIKSLKRSMFANPSAIEELNFSGNKIETLPDDIFSNMPVLKTVYFEDNQLTTVTQEVYRSVHDQSGWIFLTGNPLICDCKMLWFVTQGKGHIMGRCEGPDDKKGKNLPALTKKDLDYC